MQTRILVADDNAEIREILRILLTGEGYEVIEAKDGNEVLQTDAIGAALGGEAGRGPQIRW